MKHMDTAKKRRGWRKALALLITLVLVCGLAAPAYAEGDQETTETTQVEQENLLNDSKEEVTQDPPVVTDTNVEEPKDGVVLSDEPSQEDTEQSEDQGVPAEEKPLIDQLTEAQTCAEMLGIMDKAGDEALATLTDDNVASLKEKVDAMADDGSKEAVQAKLGDLSDKDKDDTESGDEPTQGEPTTDEPNIGSILDGLFNTTDLNDTSTYALNDIEIAVGSSEPVTGNTGFNHVWTSSNDAVATVSGKGSTATVTGVGGGNATITHSYYYYGKQRSETFTVTVTGSEANRQAQVFFLATPTSNADSNDIDQWGTGIASATVNMTGAKWTDTDKGEIKNVFNRNDPLAKYIISWPDGSTGDTWTITPGEYPDAFQEVYTAYKTSLEEQYGIEGLRLSDLTEITLTPHKISQNNGGEYPTHIDCTIDIKCNIAYTVKYHVQEPGETGYSNVYNESKAIVNGTPDTIVEHNYAQTKTVDGITYEFDGWYNEANEASKANKVETWPYAPNETELADGTVNFYARYILQLTTMTIKKEFSGLVGNDVTKPEITVTVTGDDGFTMDVPLNAENNYSYTLENLDPTVTYTVVESTENVGIEGYNLTGVTYDPENGTIQPSQSAANEVTITNTYVPANTTVTVSKHVTGGLGDKDKDFEFTVTVKQGDANANFTIGETSYTGTATFTLSDGQQVYLVVPVGSTVTVTETDYTGEHGGYTTTYTVNNGTKQDGLEAVLTAQVGDNTIAFKNHKEASPDTGVLLDSLPYVLILAAVAVAAVLMVSRKRRSRDAD